MAYTPYYKPADGRLGNQANPGYGGMAAGAAANSLRTASQAMAFIQQKAGDQIELFNKIDDDGSISSYKINVNNIKSKLQERIDNNPFAFDKHLQWAEEAAAKIRELKPKFNNPDLVKIFNGYQQEEDAQAILIGTAKDVRRGRTRAAGKNVEEEIKMYLEDGNYDAAADATMRDPFLPDDAKQYRANSLRYKGTQETLTKQLEKTMLEDPQKAMLDITRGKYDDLEATTRARMTKACERALSTDCKQIAFTSEERRKIREGGVVTPKFEVRNGATKQEYEWRKYFNEHGTYDRYKNDIKDSWINEINNAPVPEDKEDAESWIKYMVKKYCDPKTGYQVNEYELTTMAKQKMQGLLGLGNKEKGVDVRAYLERLEDRTLVPNAYNYLEQKKGESYMTSDRRKRFEGEARDIIEQRRREIRNDVAVAMSKWRAIHPDATYDKEMEQLSDFVQVYSRTHDSDIPELGTEYKKLAQDDAKKQKQMIHDATAGEDLRNTEGTAGIDTQRKMYDSYMKEQKPYFPEPSVATANNIFEVSSIQSDEAAVYLPAEQFKAIQKKLGNVPMARVTLPGTKAWVEVPVKQGDVQDVSISDSALVRMNNVRAKQAYIQFTAGDGSKPVNNEDKTSSMIFDNEARLDSNGNLTVYKLPAGDGGGTHEIAGINNGSHPQEFAKLKKMLDAGNQEEAKQEAKRYIAEKTQPVGNILQYAGVKSSGIDYFLRDMYFNSGEYGAMRVIHRALGIKDSDTKKFNQETINVLKNYIQTHSESQLLDKLKEARERLYKSIAANNPQKEKFLAGWLNRNTRVYKQAGKMA